MSKNCGRNSYALLRFTSDLLVSFNKKKPFNKDIDIGNSLTLGHVLNNIHVKKGDSNFQFLGVYVQHQPTGQVLLKAVISLYLIHS